MSTQQWEAMNVSGLRQDARTECRRRGVPSSWTVAARRGDLIAFLMGRPVSTTAPVRLGPGLRLAINTADPGKPAGRTA